MRIVLAVLLGYLLGSVSPSYLLGRLLRGIDIREHGDTNAGTVNTYRVLGLWPAVVTAVYDLSKGLVSLYLARHILGLPLSLAFLAPIAAVIGHVAPFYLKFRGGQGVATSVGILLFGLGRKIVLGEFPLTYLAFLVLVVLVFAYITRKGEMVGVVVLPLLGVYLYLLTEHDEWLFILEVVIGYVLFVNLYNLIHLQVAPLRPVVAHGIHWWRFLMRPLALIFPVFYKLVSPRFSQILLGGVALFFIALDLARLFFGKLNQLIFHKMPGFYKPKEKLRLSSITLFLISSFLVFLLFPFELALAAMLFLIFGDMAAKFYGLQYGRSTVFEKTLEGSLAFLTTCLIVSSIFVCYYPVPAPTLVLGAIAAALAEVLPIGVDDNLTVTILSASTMYASMFF